MNNNTVLETLQETSTDLAKEESRVLTIISERRVLADSLEKRLQEAQGNEIRAVGNDEEVKNKSNELREHINRMDQEKLLPVFFDTLNSLSAEQYKTFAKRQEVGILVRERQDILNTARKQYSAAMSELKAIQRKQQQIADEIHRLN